MNDNKSIHLTKFLDFPISFKMKIKSKMVRAY